MTKKNNKGVRYLVEIAPVGCKPTICITKKLTGGKDRALYVALNSYVNALCGYYHKHGEFPKKSLLPNLNYELDLLHEDNTFKPMPEIIGLIKERMKEIDIRLVVSQLPQDNAQHCTFLGCGRRGTEVGYFFVNPSYVVEGGVTKSKVDKELVSC